MDLKVERKWKTELQREIHEMNGSGPRSSSGGAIFDHPPAFGIVTSFKAGIVSNYSNDQNKCLYFS